MSVPGANLLELKRQGGWERWVSRPPRQSAAFRDRRRKTNDGPDRPVVIAGPLDDAIVAALVLRYVLRSTDRSVIQEHWHGEPRMLARLLAPTGTHTDGT
jgi:hypothetical protein